MNDTFFDSNYSRKLDQFATFFFLRRILKNKLQI